MNLSVVIKNAQVGDFIYFKDHKKGFEVQVADDRYFIATKRYFDTCLYSIFDRETMICGKNNLVFNLYDYLKQEDIERSLKDLYGFDDGMSCLKISQRNYANIENIVVGYRKKGTKQKISFFKEAGNGRA